MRSARQARDAMPSRFRSLAQRQCLHWIASALGSLVFRVVGCATDGPTGPDLDNPDIARNEPAALVITAGNEQDSTVGMPLPTAPSVRITGSQGEPVSGVAVLFHVVTGGGSVEKSETLTDDSASPPPAPGRSAQPRAPNSPRPFRPPVSPATPAHPPPPHHPHHPRHPHHHHPPAADEVAGFVTLVNGHRRFDRVCGALMAREPQQLRRPIARIWRIAGTSVTRIPRVNRRLIDSAPGSASARPARTSRPGQRPPRPFSTCGWEVADTVRTSNAADTHITG